MELQHIHNQDIDKSRWDQLIRQARGGTIYGHSWYLDVVSPDWQALVTPDYSSVMPLTCRKKFGFSYLFQPLLSQQLGIYNRSPLKPEDIDQFLSSIPTEFRLVEITLNDQNPRGTILPVQEHTTCHLNLNKPYAQISGQFSENTKRNLKKANLENMRFRTNITVPEFIEVLEKDKSAGARILLSGNNRAILSKLSSTLINRSAGMICGVKNRHGDLVAAALIAQDKAWHYYLAPAMNEEGRESRAMFYLIDRYIHLHSGLPATLDFEGSDIESVARFYKGYGATPGKYTSLRINRLPWPLKQWADRKIK